METVSRSYQSWYAYGKELLAAAGITDAAQDAWLLLEYAAAIDRSFFLMHGSEPMDEADAEEYHLLLKKRTERTPVQYLTEEAWFWGRNFYVSPDVLIPRLDTETMIDYLGRCQINGSRVLDMCTGSGCILLTLIREYGVTGVGADISEAALAVAKRNQFRMQVSDDKVSWVCSDLFANIEGAFDLIVANPPYIATDVIAGLEPEVKDHEPMIALDGERDGLYFEKKIARDARTHLTEGGMLALEIGADQGMEMKTYLESLGYEDVEIVRDLSGNDRIAAGRAGKRRG
jgi:release factor glutamine methyltransferase